MPTGRCAGILVYVFVTPTFPFFKPRWLAGTAWLALAGSCLQAQTAETLPFHYISRHILVEVKLADTKSGDAKPADAKPVPSEPLWLIVDTGAGTTSIDSGRAQEYKIALAGSIRIGGAGEGMLTGAFVRGARFTFGNPKITPQTIAMSMPMSRLEPFFGHKVDGVLGYDFLRKYVTEIDYEKQVLILHPKESFVYDGPGEAVPMTVKFNHPHIRATIEAKDKSVEGDFVVDIGSGAGIALTRTFSTEHGLYAGLGTTIATDLGGGIGGRSVGRTGRAAAVRIGSAVIESPLVSMSEDKSGALATSTYFEGNLGNQVLSRFKLFLDYQRGSIIFEPVAKSKPKENWSGVTFAAEGPAREVYTVAGVTPGGAAEKAGLQVGDVVRQVDGKPAASMGFDEFRALFWGEGIERLLVVDRTGTELRLLLLAKRLL